MTLTTLMNFDCFDKIDVSNDFKDFDDSADFDFNDFQKCQKMKMQFFTEKLKFTECSLPISRKPI